MIWALTLPARNIFLRHFNRLDGLWVGAGVRSDGPAGSRSSAEATSRTSRAGSSSPLCSRAQRTAGQAVRSAVTWPPPCGRRNGRRVFRGRFRAPDRRHTRRPSGPSSAEDSAHQPQAHPPTDRPPSAEDFCFAERVRAAPALSRTVTKRSARTLSDSKTGGRDHATSTTLVTWPQ